MVQPIGDSMSELTRPQPGQRVRVVDAHSLQVRLVIGQSGVVLDWPKTTVPLEDRHLLPIRLDGEKHVMWVGEDDVEMTDA